MNPSLKASGVADREHRLSRDTSPSTSRRPVLVATLRRMGACYPEWGSPDSGHRYTVTSQYQPGGRYDVRVAGTWQVTCIDSGDTGGILRQWSGSRSSPTPSAPPAAVGRFGPGDGRTTPSTDCWRPTTRTHASMAFGPASSALQLRLAFELCGQTSALAVRGHVGRCWIRSGRSVACTQHVSGCS
jgi:hypothetical protein